MKCFELVKFPWNFLHSESLYPVKPWVEQQTVHFYGFTTLNCKVWFGPFLTTNRYFCCLTNFHFTYLILMRIPTIMKKTNKFIAGEQRRCSILKQIFVLFHCHARLVKFLTDVSPHTLESWMKHNYPSAVAPLATLMLGPAADQRSLTWNSFLLQTESNLALAFRTFLIHLWLVMKCETNSIKSDHYNNIWKATMMMNGTRHLTSCRRTAREESKEHL